MKTLFFVLLLGACSVSVDSDSRNKAVQFYHMINESAECIPLGQDPYAFDAAMCRNGQDIVFVQAGVNVIPRFGTIYSPKPVTAPTPGAH